MCVCLYVQACAYVYVVEKGIYTLIAIIDIVVQKFDKTWTKLLLDKTNKLRNDYSPRGEIGFAR